MLSKAILGEDYLYSVHRHIQFNALWNDDAKFKSVATHRGRLKYEFSNVYDMWRLTAKNSLKFFRLVFTVKRIHSIAQWAIFWRRKEGIILENLSIIIIFKLFDVLH